LDPRLKELVEARAQELGLEGGMGELAAQILAALFGRDDLAKVPRKRMGRPPGSISKKRRRRLAAV
jgi:hypothetical protein